MSVALEREEDGRIGHIQEKRQRRWYSYVWDTFDKSPEERKFLFKLDTALLSFASLGEIETPLPTPILTTPRLFYQGTRTVFVSGAVIIDLSVPGSIKHKLRCVSLNNWHA